MNESMAVTLVAVVGIIGMVVIAYVFTKVMLNTARKEKDSNGK